MGTWAIVRHEDFLSYKEKSGLSWREIADKLGVTRGATYCWQVGRYAPPPERQEQMVTILGLPRVEGAPTAAPPLPQPRPRPTPPRAPLTSQQTRRPIDSAEGKFIADVAGAYMKLNHVSPEELVSLVRALRGAL